MENQVLQIKPTIDSKEHDKDKQIIDVLLSIGISANLQGYYFLKESIKLAMSSPAFINSITKLMYPEVAQRYQTTACRVERAMRHAIEVSFNKGKIVCLNEIFGLNIFDKNDKPTNAEFVALVADRLALGF